MRRLRVWVWPPARRRERKRRERLYELRWDLWFHCLATRNTDEWFARYRELLTEIETCRIPPAQRDDGEATR